MIKIDDIEVTEDEFLSRIEITPDDEYDSEYCEDFLDLFYALGISPLDENGKQTPIENLVEELSAAYLDFVDFATYDSRIHNIIN